MYIENGDKVTLELTRDQFERIILALGWGIGAATRDGDKTLLYRWVKLANEINEGNPRWTPYEIPEEVKC
jgi:hypothetical protein